MGSTIRSTDSTAFGPTAPLSDIEAWHSKDRLIRVGMYACASAYIGSEGEDMTRIGVVVHEMGHMFCLPDLLPGVGYWVGNYDCMGNMWGQDGSQYYPGLMGAWSRATVGWVTSTVIDQPGRNSIQAAVDAPQAYTITHGFPAGESTC